MSLMGELLGSSTDTSATAPAVECTSRDLQKEAETEAAFEHLYVTAQWLAAEIARQFLVSFDAAFAHLLDMPDEHLRHLATPFGWTWLAHDTVRSLGGPEGSLLKITVH